MTGFDPVRPVRLALSICVVWINLLVCLTLSHTPDFQTALGTLIKSLTCADIILGISCLVDSLRLLLDRGPDIKTCNTISFALNISVGVTIATFGYISYDRFYALVYPKNYPTVLSNRKACLFVWGSYIIGGILFVPSLLGWEVDDYPPRSCLVHWEDYSNSSFFLIFLLIVGSMFFISVCCFYIMQASMNGHFMNSKDYCGLDLDRRTAKVILGVVIVFYLMWLPFVIMTVIRIFSYLWTSDKLYDWFLNLGLAFVIAKFVIYLKWLPAFRSGFLEMCCVIGCKFVDCLTELCKNYIYVVPLNWSGMGNYSSLEEHYINIDSDF